MTKKTNIKNDYISLDQLIERNNNFPANKKFFKLLEKHKEGKRKDFAEEWNGWIESDKNKDLTLNFSNFYFDINDKAVKEKFYLLIRRGCWDFDDLHLPRTNFIEVKFYEEVSFWKTVFHKRVSFRGTVFHEEVTFQQATFYGEADFWITTFHERVISRQATFYGEANFFITTFYREVVFNKAIFNNYVYFRIKFNNKKEDIDLKNTVFNSKSFFNMGFLSRANLSSAFFDINNINFLDRVCPSGVKKDVANYRIFRRYYSNKLDHTLERRYFALELENKAAKIKTPDKWDIKILYLYIRYSLKRYSYHFCRLCYKGISNYGENIFIPMLILFFLIYPLITICYGENYLDIMYCNLPFMDYSTTKCPDKGLRFFGKLLTYVSLFLSGLAIRNKFKIK